VGKNATIIPISALSKDDLNQNWVLEELPKLEALYAIYDMKNIGWYCPNIHLVGDNQEIRIEQMKHSLK